VFGVDAEGRSLEEITTEEPAPKESGPYSP